MMIKRSPLWLVTFNGLISYTRVLWMQTDDRPTDPVWKLHRHRYECEICACAHTLVYQAQRFPLSVQSAQILRRTPAHWISLNRESLGRDSLLSNVDHSTCCCSCWICMSFPSRWHAQKSDAVFLTSGWLDWITCFVYKTQRERLKRQAGSERRRTFCTFSLLILPEQHAL